MFHILQSDLSMIAFGPEQVIESPNSLKWAQSSRKLLIYPVTLCPFYSLTKVAGAYSIKFYLFYLIYLDLCTSLFYFIYFIFSLVLVLFILFTLFSITHWSYLFYLQLRSNPIYFIYFISSHALVLLIFFISFILSIVKNWP